MAICFNQEKNVFLLNTPSSTYVIRVYEGRVLHGGWFHSLPDWSGVLAMPLFDRANAAVPADLGERAVGIDADMAASITDIVNGVRQE